MKKILLICLLIPFSRVLSQETTGVYFSKISFSQALTMSKKIDKPIFIDCYTHWCGPCKKMDKNVFPEKNVGIFYNQNFINLKLDMDKPEGREVLEKYNITGFPTLLFLNSDGKTINRASGGLDANTLNNVGKKAIENSIVLKPIRSKINNGDRSAQTLISYLNILPNAIDKNELLTEYFNTKNKKEKLSLNSWKLFNNHINDLENPMFDFFLKNKKKYLEFYGKSKVDLKILKGFKAYAFKNRKAPNKIASLKNIDPEIYSILETDQDLKKALSESKRAKRDPNKWSTFITKTREYFSTNAADPDTLNSVCWFIYENRKNFRNANILNSARKWSKYTIDSEPKNHHFNDTFAHILFELGYVEKAIQFQNKAIQLNPTDFYLKELERFKRDL